jgi:hypothetical protein
MIVTEGFEIHHYFYYNIILFISIASINYFKNTSYFDNISYYSGISHFNNNNISTLKYISKISTITKISAFSIISYSFSSASIILNVAPTLSVFEMIIAAI